jgi:CubicO group peptidase (beta-lactamase class C family)
MVMAAVTMVKGDPTLREALEQIRQEAHLPSLCGGAIVNGKIVALEAVGVRKDGTDDKVTVDDLYHCGSNTKSFTAALTALYVQRKKLTWDTPIATLLPEASQGMNPSYAKITPLLLAAHRAGLTGETYPPGMPSFNYDKKDLPGQRQKYAAALLKTPPVGEVGTKYVYSNGGFLTLGAALERLNHQPWEELLTEEILKPLGLKSAGFGSAPVGQPWGHYEKDGKLVPVAPGPFGDNLPVLGPAGTLHMSVSDMLRWCAFQADEGHHGGILTPESFAVLHTPIGEYGGGFLQLNRPWAGGQALTHSGSNTMNYQTIWIAPKKGFGVVVATNAMRKDTPQAIDKACGVLIQRFCPK